jgi:hypothetical protein
MRPEEAIRRASAEEQHVGVVVGTAFLKVSYERIADLLGQG